MGKNKSSEKQPKTPQNIYFSFANILDKCVVINHQDYFSFTNRVPVKEIRKYRTIIEHTLHNWSKKTITQLGQDQECFPVKKDIVNQTRNNIARVFKGANYNSN